MIRFRLANIIADILILNLIWTSASARSDEPRPKKELTAERQDKEPKKLTPEERKKLEAEWKRLEAAGVKHYQEGKYPEAQKSFDAALALARRLYPKEEYPDGHENIAVILNNLGETQRAQGKLGKAEPLCRDALAMKKLLFKGDHPDVAMSMNNLAGLLQTQGKLAEAEPLFRDSLAMIRRLFSGDHRYVATSVNNLGVLLTNQGKLAEAEPLYRDALAMRQRLFKGDHPDVAQSLKNVAHLLTAQGKPAEAEPLQRDALAMYKRLFKGDHPDVAGSLNNLAYLLKDQGKLADAEPLLRDALAMNKRLFKGDHPDVAGSLNNLAALLTAHGKLAEAEPLLRDALAMNKWLFKGDHPAVADSLSNLAYLLKPQGKLAEAEPLYRDALTMRQRLFKGDHPDVAASLSNLASLLSAQGKLAEAELLSRDALAMFRRLLTTYARQKTEGDALNLVASQPGTRNGFLSLSWRLKSESASVYAEVWASKGAIARVFEQRQQAGRAAASNPDAVQLLAELAQTRRERSWLILAPQTKDPATKKKRDDDIKALEEKITGLERDLRPLLPGIARAEKLTAAGPADLQKALPSDAALVDFLRYTFNEHDPTKPGKAGEKRTLSYLAFVVTNDRIAWLDLGPAGPIEESVAAWREAILKPAAQARADRAIPGRVRELAWAKVRKELPASTKTVFISPDFALCRLPWAALPGDRPDTILLEDFALVTIPHSPFLLDQLWPREELSKSPTGLVVVGGVKYDAEAKAALDTLVVSRGEPLVRADAKASWRFLDGTLAEARSVVGLAELEKLPLTAKLEGEDATTTAVLAQLPRAKYVHFATHGFFADPSFRSVFQIDPKEFEQTLRGERVGRAATSPLVMTGLVFAGANQAKTPGRGIVTGEALVDLDLSGLELAVLSACETGLGDVAGGEGVFGLQRAFHLAGARSVVASLWKVSDRGTQLLMTRFYENLWQKKMAKLDALREAQLWMLSEVPKQPELMRSIRGLELVENQKPDHEGRLPPFYWAAFVLSGDWR